MKIETKAQVLNDLYMVARNREEWDGFFKYADLGVPASIMFLGEYFTMTPKIEALITETYDMLVKVLDIPDVEYASLDELFDAALEK